MVDGTAAAAAGLIFDRGVWLAGWGNGVVMRFIRRRLLTNDA